MKYSIIHLFGCSILMGCISSASDDEVSDSQVPYSSSFGLLSSSSELQMFAPSSILGRSLQLGRTIYSDISSTGTCSFDDGPDVTISSTTKWEIQGTPRCQYTKIDETSANFTVNYSKKATMTGGSIQQTTSIKYTLTFSSENSGTFKYLMNTSSVTIIYSNSAYNTTKSNSHTGNGSFSIVN